MLPMADLTLVNPNHKKAEASKRVPPEILKIEEVAEEGNFCPYYNSVSPERSGSNNPLFNKPYSSNPVITHRTPANAGSKSRQMNSNSSTLRLAKLLSGSRRSNERLKSPKVSNHNVAY